MTDTLFEAHPHASHSYWRADTIEPLWMWPGLCHTREVLCSKPIGALSLWVAGDRTSPSRASCQRTSRALSFECLPVWAVVWFLHLTNGQVYRKLVWLWHGYQHRVVLWVVSLYHSDNIAVCLIAVCLDGCHYWLTKLKSVAFIRIIHHRCISRSYFQYTSILVISVSACSSERFRKVLLLHSMVCRVFFQYVL